MHRFFVENNQILDKEILIIGKDVKHIKDVLRLKVGDFLELVSQGYLYKVSIKEISKSQILTEIISKSLGKNETKTHIRLFQGLAKGSKMETIFQKGTEIGIKEFHPIVTKRTVVKLDKKKEDSKIMRWNAITQEASKQAKRDQVPKVMRVQTLDDMVDFLKDQDHILVAYEDEDTISIKEVLSKIEGDDINILIGPEGGFEEDEIQSLREIGAEIVSLGSRILRTETAGLVTASLILYEKDDLGVIQ